MGAWVWLRVRRALATETTGEGRAGVTASSTSVLMVMAEGSSFFILLLGGGTVRSVAAASSSSSASVLAWSLRNFFQWRTGGVRLLGTTRERGSEEETEAVLSVPGEEVVDSGGETWVSSESVDKKRATVSRAGLFFVG